jgi:TonB-linked SusC/RagA family outer membrane protein
MKPEWFTPKGLASRTGTLASALVAVLLLLTSVGAASAQEGAVAGGVTDPFGEFLIGVQVFIPGTSYGTLTDDAGRYRITGVPAGDYTLRASIIGYQGSEEPVTVTAGEVATVNFVLEVSAVALDEVVATITGERRRRELAAAISTVDATVVQSNIRTQDVTSVLKGQSTGVYVRTSSGNVGTGSDVRIRGTGSISLSSAPLYVIDGAIVDSEPNLNTAQFDEVYIGGQEATRLHDLNPDEIESIEVIKGPAASALWGARGTAGVVVITTKKGSAGETRWNARADLGANTQPTGFVARDAEVDAGGRTSFTPGNFATTGWNPMQQGFATDTIYTMNLLEQFPVFESGLIQNYNGNVTGGAGLWNYFGSVQYGNEKGTLPNNSSEKFNFRANFGVDPSDKLNLSFSNGYTSSNLFLPDNDNNSRGYIGIAQIGFPFNNAITFPDPITGELVETCPFEVELSKATGEPTAGLDACPDTPFFAGRSYEDVASLINEKKIERYTGSGNVTWNPIQQWTNRFTLGYDMVNDRTNATVPVDPDLSFGTASQGNVAKPFESSRNLTLQGTTTYNLRISDPLGFEFVGGVQWFRRTIESTLVTGQTFPATGPSVGNSVINTGNDLFDEQKSLGFFVQGQFDWKNRLFVNGAIRWDNNSASGENLNTQTYPKFGASFVALEGQGVFNTLRFRGAWGRSGTLPGTNDALALVGIQQVAFEGTDQLGITPDRPGNTFLQPEVGEEWEAGFDLAMLQDRLGLVFTYYDQKTNNTVVSKNLAPSVGFPNQVFTNIGRIDNNGLEVELDALIVAAENFTWDLRMLGSRNNNQIVQLDDPIIYGLGGSSQRHQEGLPFGSYVQPQVAILEDGEAGVLTCAMTPGTWGPDDQPGANEDFCDPLDNSRWNGQPNARYEGSLQTTFQLFKYVQLYALFDFQSGHQRMNNNGDFMCGFLFGAGLNGGVCIDGMTSGGEEPSDYTKVIAEASRIQTEAPWVMSGSFAKFRTAQIRFDMPPSVTRFLKLSGLQIQFIGENLVTWTDYNGADPEVNWAGQSNATVTEFLTLPIRRRFLGTINIFF